MEVNLSLKEDRVVIGLQNVAGPVPKVHDDGTFTTGLDCDYDSLVIFSAISIVGGMILSKRLNMEYAEDESFMTDVWAKVDALIQNMKARAAELEANSKEIKEEER